MSKNEFITTNVSNGKKKNVSMVSIISSVLNCFMYK